MKIKIINRSDNEVPSYATEGAAGMDIRANLTTPITLAPLERKLIPTGLHIELPKGYEAQLRARSSWALKRGLILPNAPATIDSDYRGEIKVIFANISQEPQTIQHGERIAQMVIAQYVNIQWEIVTKLSDSNRGEGGFGSTGIT